MSKLQITFKLRYHTHPGQLLFVWGDHIALATERGCVEDQPQHGRIAEQAAAGAPTPAHSRAPIALHYVDAETWQVTLEVPRAALKQPITYHYVLRQADGSTERDADPGRVIHPDWSNQAAVVVVDSWNPPGLVENVFFTEPFQKVLLKVNQSEPLVPPPARVTHQFRVKAPLLKRGQTLCLLGNSPVLGQWNPERSVRLNRKPGEVFLTANLDLSGDAASQEYKYGVFDVERGTFLGYENGENRRLTESAMAQGQVVVSDGFVRLPAETWRGAGVAIPVFSLRSGGSFGVGEFTDLKLLVDWCDQTGLKLIQILPINDTTATNTWADSYPYAAISAFALHPLYLNLAGVVSKKNRAQLEALEAERLRLNTLAEVDYEAVMQMKWRFLRQIFPSQKVETFRSAEYKKFLQASRHWLVPYATFCCLRDKFGTADFSQWPSHQTCRDEDIAALMAASGSESDAIQLHCFVQFLLHRQLQEATAYAHANGVILKGDIAIGVHRHGADTWQQPELYHLDMQAGAPPDPFAAKGQNWGFPTYNWARMKQDGFAWWKRRFAQMDLYFDAFRIDHILGFFRIWSIPLDAVEGILGYFVPAIPVDAGEFSARGIPFSKSRLVEPFITDAVLREIFGANADAVKQQCLDATAPGHFALKPAFATQQLVEKFFQTPAASGFDERLKLGLFDLISNVILFEVAGAGERQFHFRFNIGETASFRALNAQTQARLLDLYVDYFFRRQDEFWRQEAWEKLPALKRVTNMLICGEDLGLVPACVPDVMKQLGLLSLEIQRMPKTPGRAFSRPAAAPYLSVVTPSTHDMSTIRGWWTEDAQLAQRFYHEELQLPGPAPAECHAKLNEAVVHQHLASPAMWSIFQLQDLLGVDETLRRPDADAERINVPAIPKHYWRYRMHLTLEQLLAATAFNGKLSSLVTQHAR